jgi:CheY-like chemotaxis protein
MHSLDGSHRSLEKFAQSLPSPDASAIPTGLADWQISALQIFTAAYPLLVTDDDAMSRMFYRALLVEQCGFRLIDTGHPDEALHLCQSQPVGLVISCIVKSASMDGLDLIDNLRRLPQTHYIPVLLISGSVQLHELAAQAGADAYLTKPCHPNEILQEIWLLLRERVL